MRGDDWKIGIYVTVIKGRKHEEAVGGGMFGGIPTGVVTHTETSGMYDLYRVVAVALPKVLLSPGLLRGCKWEKASMWDTNRYCFGRVPEEYVRVVLEERAAAKEAP
jgi:hypothetical protein